MLTAILALPVTSAHLTALQIRAGMLRSHVELLRVTVMEVTLVVVRAVPVLQHLLLRVHRLRLRLRPLRPALQQRPPVRVALLVTILSVPAQAIFITMDHVVVLQAG